MAKQFQALPPEKKQTARIEIKLTEADSETIRISARARNLNVSEFIRRAALGRRADVIFETENILALREVVMAIREWHAAFVEHGIAPPRDVLGAIVDAALAAMLRIEK